MSKFNFGIYPGGLTGTHTGITTGYEDNPAQVSQALDELQGDLATFTVRVYKAFKGEGQWGALVPEEYLGKGRKLDLVLMYQCEADDMAGWEQFIITNISEYGNNIECLQITEEANIDLPVLDGHYKYSRKALVYGVISAKKEIRAQNLDIKVGFNATPDFSPDKHFWAHIASLANSEFYEALDYVGLDFFPDVFQPVVKDNNLDGIRPAIRFVINDYKRNCLGAAGITSSIPLHITENGWPTGASRGYEKQAKILEAIIRAIHSLRNEFNIAKYELFDLRDADSDVDDIFYQFGIMRHDYTPKPAFTIFKLLVAELSEE